jgi:hypothetical protein
MAVKYVTRDLVAKPLIPAGRGPRIQYAVHLLGQKIIINDSISTKEIIRIAIIAITAPH